VDALRHVFFFSADFEVKELGVFALGQGVEFVAAEATDVSAVEVGVSPDLSELSPNFLRMGWLAPADLSRLWISLRRALRLTGSPTRKATARQAMSHILREK
jgi:hypothetical protein